MAEAVASTRLGLNKTQTTTFFMSSKQMEVAKETLEEVGKEGIKGVIWKQVADNLKRLGGRMKNPGSGADKNHAM
eukprot:1270531-Ditylum_brightwellii.AAC.1